MGGLAPGNGQPSVPFFGICQDHRHGLGADGADVGVGLCGWEGEKVGGLPTGTDLPSALPARQVDAGEESQRHRIIAGQAEPDGPVLADRVPAGLAEGGEGTRQRCSGTSQGFEWLELVLPTLVVPLSGSIFSSSAKSTSSLLAPRAARRGAFPKARRPATQLRLSLRNVCDLARIQRRTWLLTEPHAGLAIEAPPPPTAAGVCRPGGAGAGGRPCGGCPGGAAGRWGRGRRARSAFRTAGRR